MKKYLKLQAKKSVSLFLAVIMLLSCWVWIAPEKASAADADKGEYRVRMIVTVTDPANMASFAVGVYKPSGEKVQLTCAPTAFETAGSAQVIVPETDLTYFPQGFDMSLQVKTGCGTLGNLTCSDFRLQVYNNSTSEWNTVNKEDNTLKYTDKGNEGHSVYKNSNTGCQIKNDAWPVISKGTVDDAGSVTIPDIGSDETITKSYTPVFRDQYGVKMKPEAAPSVFIGTAADATTAVDNTAATDKSGFYSEYNNKDGVASVTITADMQKNFLVTSEASATKDYYLISSVTNSKQKVINGYLKITVKYPTYTITVNNNGGTLALSNSTTDLNSWTKTGTYGTEATLYPTGGRDSERNFIGAEKTGFTFMGFWTEAQPTGGDASANSVTADFAMPVSSAQFETYKATTGASASGNIVTLADGKKYYNAGEEWDSTKHKRIEGNKDFYAWWISKDIPAKFYDIDGAYLGEIIFKYGDTPEKAAYKDPKYTDTSYDGGAFTYEDFAGKWRDITGKVIIEGEYTFGVDGLESLSLTPIYSTKTYNKTYTVEFINPVNGTAIAGGEGVASGEYKYRHVLSGENIPEPVMPYVLSNNNGYTYRFEGWTSQKPASGNYHVYAENDSSFTLSEDMIVRENITYYAVYRSTVKVYAISFTYTDSTGTRTTVKEYVPYGSAITTPAYVNRTYAKGGYGYNLEGWKYANAENKTVSLDVDGIILLNDTNFLLADQYLQGAVNETPVTFTADYDEGAPTPYTVTFKYKDAKGKDVSLYEEVYHGKSITQEMVNGISVPETYDDGEALYTFANIWLVTEGTADKAEYTKDEFTSFSPTSHVTFEAVYDDGVPFYTVKYSANNMPYEERVLQGSNVPAWMIQTGTDENGDPIKEEYVPADYEAETGTYKFVGWYDEPQKDSTFAVTNGTKYTTASTVEGDLSLYAQYVFEPFKYIIKFMDYTGEVQLAAAEVEAGQSYEQSFITAQKAAQYRASDETYSYEFIGWDYPVPDNYLCEGKNVTYTAQYKPSYIYYSAQWYNSLDEMNKKTPIMTGDKQTGIVGLLATTNYTYNGAVFAPSVALTPPPNAPVGESYVFAGWKYLEDGVETDYVRGMTITGNMEFYATYETTKNALTVTAVIDENTSETYTVKHGEALGNKIGTPVDGFVDKDYHRVFEAWYSDAACNTLFEVGTIITENITIYAKFKNEKHVKDQKELIKAPTYYEKGIENIWCACSKEDTLVEKVEIPKLTDNVAPTGTIYLGTHGFWNSESGPAGYDTDGEDEIAISANADTDIIITVNDKGDVNPAYNPSGEGIGIRNIKAFAYPADTVLTATGYGAAQKIAVDIFTDDTNAQNNTANFTASLGDLFVVDLDEYGDVQYETNENGEETVKYKPLENGKAYIVYYYATDKAGNMLRTRVRTARFIYDTSAPEFEIIGDCNTGLSTTTYCEKAIISNVEVGATVEINGEETTLTTTTATGVGSYTINEPGNYLIKVTDKAGNSTSKKIKVTDGHTEVKTGKAATCTEDGYNKVECAICNKVITNEPIPAAGHSYGAKVTVAPSCTKEGYDIQVCSVCGYEDITNDIPAPGHIYPMDADNNVIYTVITPATCKTEGKEIASCTVCGGETIESGIPVDTENGHVYGGLKTLKPTCTEPGETYRICKYCFTKKTVETLSALNHTDTGRSTKITIEATCYSEGEKTIYCKGCGEIVGTEVIPTIAHTLVLVTHDTDTDKTNEYPNGYMQYECQVAGCTHTEGKTAIAAKPVYTITFKGADENGEDVLITKTEGETIAAGAVADQTKAKDDEYEYTFAGWKGADGKIIKLPIVASKDETYTAEFTATKRIYKHIFQVPDEASALSRSADEYKEFATIIGAYNDTNKVPASVPTLKATATATYEFLGWRAIDESEVTTDFTMTGDKTFIAVFVPVPIKFNVVFYNGGVAAATAIVNGGATAAAPANNPTKAPDENGHYEFCGWYISAEAAKAARDDGKFDFANTQILADTRIYAGYTTTAHIFDETVNEAEKTWAATCTEAGQTTTVCDCGYEKVETIAALGHDYSIELEDGSKQCSRCDSVLAPEAKTVKITFNEKVGEAIAELKADKEAKEGEEVTYTAPEKESTKQYEYKFVQWIDADGNVVSLQAEITVTAGAENAEYYAVYTAITRTYLVMYLDHKGNLLQNTEVAYGDPVPAAPADPIKPYADRDHYIFIGWDMDESITTVTGEMKISPIFDPVAHEWVNTGTTVDATCTKPGGLVYECTCGASKEVGGDRPTGHKFTILVEAKAATYEEDGYIIKKCANCEETNTEILKKREYKYITVTVKDSNGNIVEGAKVDLYRDAEWCQTNYSNANGVATFKVGDEDYKYTVLITGVEGLDKNEIEVGDDGKVDVGTQAPDMSCKCSCHKDNFWGIIFRFFHKLISYLTGEIRCCECPDPKY